MIRDLAKKSLFLRRLVRGYRLRKKQPNWDSILTNSRPLWNSSLDISEKGPKILIATSVGSYLAGTTMESLIALALTLRGAEVHILLCDSVLPACFDCWIGWDHNPKQFAAHGPKKNICKDCFSSAYNMYRILGIPVHRYSEFLHAEDREKAESISSVLPFDTIGNYFLDGVAVGEHALAGTLRFYARGTLEGEPHAEAILRRYLKAAILTTCAMRSLLNKFHFTSAVFHHGIYVPQGLVGESCRKANVPVVNWNPAYRKKCFIFSHHDTYHHTMMTESEDKWINIPWSEKMESELMDYLKSRWQGTQDWIWFHEKPKLELQDIANKTGIDFTKPCIGMLTSVMWDAVLHYPSNAFSSMMEWIECTIDYFITRLDLQLIIRIHPAEVRGTLPSRQHVADEIKKLYPSLPKNIIVVPPESDASTYAVMMQCDSVIIYNTKTGVELTAMGIPVIVAGEAWIRNKGFAVDVENPHSYFKILDKLPLKTRMSKETTLKARKYAYHFFFRRMIPIEFTEPAGGAPPFTIRLSALEDLLPGRSKGLDVVCDGILTGSDFIFPADQTIEPRKREGFQHPIITHDHTV